MHEDIAEVIGDDTNEDEESAVLDMHEDSVRKTLTLITRLIDTKTIHLDTMALIEELEAEVCTHPDNLYTSTLQRLEDNRKELERALNRSTISSTRPVKRFSASNYPHSSVILRTLGLKYGIRKSSSKYGKVGVN